jgi:dTDP-glucose 4,6-dehydratase
MRELGWVPETKFEDGIVKTINWYLNNRDWLNRVTTGKYMEYYEKIYGGK